METIGKGWKAREGVGTYNFQVSETGNSPNSNLNYVDGLSSADVAWATRVLFQLRLPGKLLENDEVFMHRLSCSRSATSNISVSTSRIPVMWHKFGNRFARVGMGMKQGKLGGWKAASCSKLILHAIKDMNEWVWKDNVKNSAMDVLGVPDDRDFSAAGYKAVVEGDGMMLQELLDIATRILEFKGMRESTNGDSLV